LLITSVVRMFKIAVCLVLVALLASVSATVVSARDLFVAPQCNATTTCIHSGGNCANPTAPDQSVYCAYGYYCSGNVCTAKPTLGQSCSAGVGCFDANYQVACVSGTCQYYSIFAPGESCSTAANYNNGGCPAGYTCSTTCSVTATGSDCSTIGCHNTDYCDPVTKKCVARVGSGATCAGSGQCTASFICTNHGSGTAFTCQSPFAQTAGAGCLSYFDCAAGLACVASKCQAPTNVGVNCQNNAGACNTATSGSVCECTDSVSGDTVTETAATCVSTAQTQADIDAYNNLQNCLVSNGCFDLNWRSGDGALLGVGLGPGSCASKCASVNTPLNSCLTGASATLLPLFGVLVAVVLAVLSL